MGFLRIRHVATAVLAGLALLAATTAQAAGAHSDPAIIEALDQEGRYLELTDGGLDSAIDRANSEGIAFAWMDQGGDLRVAESLADDYVEDLDEIGSRYRTVIVLSGDGFGASSLVYDQDELNAALDASFDSFAAGAAGRGVDTFSEVLVGSLTTSTTSVDQNGSGDSDGGGGIGFGTIIVGIALLGGGFLAIRAWSGGRKRKKQATLDMEDDRAEIKEQLKNNADRVISLGDKVIAKGDQQLISTYEKASATYQDVSQSIDGATTAAEVDELDDRIDHAEWQFEVIEAELNGLPVPRSPAEIEAEAETKAAEAKAAEAMPPPPATSGRAEPGVVTSPRTGRQYPTNRRTTPRRGGGLGGLGGGLGSILGSVILGGGLGGGNRSRRSQRRSGYSTGRTSIGTGRTTSGGGLGGGVLRRGGSSNSGSRSSGSRTSRSSRRSGSGRNFGRSKSRGGRRF